MRSLGQCTVSVLLPEGPGAHDSIAVDTFEMNYAADELLEKCVISAGSGGKYTPTIEYRRDSAISLPVMVLYAPKSKWDDFIALKYSCRVNAKGTSECKSIPKGTQRTKGGAYGPWRYMGVIGQQGWRIAEGGGESKCSGSCSNPTDCDINSDCLCAAKDRGKEVAPFSALTLGLYFEE